MAYETILYEVKDRVARVTINRPDKRNALNATVIAELIAAFRAADADASAGAIVLTGAGEKAFCAGADLGGGGMIGAQTVYERHEAGRSFLDMFRTMRAIGKPIVCAAAASASRSHAMRSSPSTTRTSARPRSTSVFSRT